MSIWGASSSFEVEGATLSIRHTSHVENESDTGIQCDQNKTGTYEVQVIASANLRFAAIEDSCTERVGFLASEGDREWKPAPEPGPVAAADDLAGVRQRQGG